MAAVMNDLNETIHQPVRLRVMAALTALKAGEEVDFTYLKDLLEVTDGNLGAHLRKLEEAGYIAVNKVFIERKPRTYVLATPAGRKAFQAHTEALKTILKGGENSAAIARSKK
jgi:DNA-binding MarR family transcriptional regulator